MEPFSSKFKIKKVILISMFLLAAIGSSTFFFKKGLQEGLVKIQTQENWVPYASSQKDPQGKWKPYSSSDNRFQVDFPKEPVHESKQLDIPSTNEPLQYNEIRAEQSNVVYAVSYIDFPQKWRLASSNTLLKKSLALLIEHDAKGQRLMEQKLTAHNGFPAIDYVVKEGTSEIKGRLILVNHTFYRLTATYPSTIASQAQHTEFVNSFNLS